MRDYLSTADYQQLLSNQEVSVVKMELTGRIESSYKSAISTHS